MVNKSKLFKNKFRFLDVFEQVVLVVLCIALVLRLWPGSFSKLNFYLLLLILSESIGVFLVLIRKPTENISNSFSHWLIAFCGSILPLLVIGGEKQFMPRVGAFLLLFGFCIHVGAKLSLFRSFGVVPANRGVKVNGFYSLVRHPMYAGYFLTHTGFLLAVPSLWNFVIYICSWGLMVSRIYLEEELLSKSQDYQEYKKQVRYRIIPGVF